MVSIMLSMNVWMAELARLSCDTRCACNLRTGCPSRQTFRMDMASCLAGLIQLFAKGMFEPGAPVVDQFGNNGARDLLRQHRADIQSNWHVDAFEPLACNSFTGELLGDGPNLPFASNHYDISRIGLNCPAENILIFLVATRNDDHIRVLVRHNFIEGLLEAFGINRFGFRKPLAVGINRTIVDDGRLESSNGRNLRDLSRDVAGSEDHDLRRRQDRFDKNFQLASADEAAFGHRFIGEVEAHNAGLLVPDHILSGSPDLGFNTAASHRPKRRPIITDKHLRGLETGHGSPNLHDSGQGRLASLLPQTLNFIKDVDLHKALSLTYLLTLLVSLS